MAQQALTAGMTVPRKRALFGLLDADGWALGVGQGRRLVGRHHHDARLHPGPGVLLHGRPDRRPGRHRLVADQPLPARRTRRCRARRRSARSCRGSPRRRSWPCRRADRRLRVQVGTRLLYIGGTDGTTAQSTVYVATTTGHRQLRGWTPGPALPAPRTDAAVVVRRRQDLRDRRHGRRRRADDRPLRADPDSATGELGEWKPSRRPDPPEARTGAAAVATADGLLLIGGSNAAGPVATTWKSPLDARARSASWTPEAAARDAADRCDRGHRRRLSSGCSAAHGADGPIGRRPARHARHPAAAEGLPENPDEGKLVAWAISDAANLPARPRRTPRRWAANGASMSPAATTGPARSIASCTGRSPTTAGDIAEWKHLDVSDLPAAATGGAPSSAGRMRSSWAGTTDGRGPAASLRGEHRAAGAVLPAGPGRGDRPGAQDRRRDRPAARLPERGRRRDGELHHPDRHRLGVRPQGAGAPG